MNELRRDGFLGGRIHLWQPAHGYRAGADAVMLAAACAARSGQSVLELGCGAGTALLCLGTRVAGLSLSGIEIQPDYADLARRNLSDNGMRGHIHQADLAQMPAALLTQGFDHVIANPPYFLKGTPAPLGRGTARHETLPLENWMDAGLRRLKPGGWLTVIQRADRLDDILAALRGRAGDITILPIAARQGRPAGRVIVAARKGARGPLQLLAAFIMHMKPSHSGDLEDLTPEASGILRNAMPLLLSAKEKR